jgi:hypothetical protein
VPVAWRPPQVDSTAPEYALFEGLAFLEAPTIVLDAPLLLALAAVISSVSGLVWSGLVGAEAAVVGPVAAWQLLVGERH